VLRRNQHNMSDICGNTLGNMPRVLAGDMLGNAPSGSPLLFGHFPKHIRYSVKVAEKVTNTLWAFPKESPILFRYFSNGLSKLLDTFPSESWHNLGISFFFLNCFWWNRSPYCLYFPLPPLRGQPTAKRHPRWQPISGQQSTYGWGDCWIQTQDCSFTIWCCYQ
jgi:hypothetical protein